MKTLHVKIGEHHIKFVSPYKHLLTKFREEYEILKGNKRVKPHLLIYLESGYGTSFINYEVDNFRENGKIIFRRSDYQITVDSDYKVAKLYFHDDLALKHAMMNLYSSFIVYHNWGLLIHSSAVVNDSKAFIFAGQSGAGKSTSAMLSIPRTILSDEAAIVKIDKGVSTVYHSPFRSEIKPTNLTEYSPVEGIYLLHQSYEIHKHAIKRSDAFLQLMDKVFYWSREAEDTKKIIVLLKKLVNLTPVHHLYFQKNDKFWEVIS
ncbi:hypothetical protein ABN702_00800 [Bacillus haimaensis]|uniref:hypothetical protein n=1 Tax=Bacillus haimaensis TaxID=3160967 RepID=UPI003AA813E3